MRLFIASATAPTGRQKAAKSGATSERKFFNILKVKSFQNWMLTDELWTKACPPKPDWSYSQSFLDIGDAWG
jgi:hypothetical protein